ncbi:MAG: TatD family hydrolase [Minisyncoccia bacterium]
MIKFFDAHTHIQFNAFSFDWQEVLGRAIENNIGLINVGTQKLTSQKAIDLAYEYEKINPHSKGMIYAAVGLHPIHTFESYYDENELGAPSSNNNEKYSFKSRAEEFDYNFYKNLAKDNKVLAIGECGLDYFRIESNEQKEKQIEAFEQQILLAYEVKKPLMIHCRKSYNDLINILKNNQNNLNSLPGIVHFFSGTKEDARNLLNLGFYFTFGGVITFSRDYDEVIKFIPNDKILSETDAPYVSPAPYRGKRNEPLYVLEVIKKLAEIKNQKFEEFNFQILKNIKTLFKQVEV